MHKPQWYVVDRLNSAVLCRDRQEAEDIVADNIARYPFTGPWRVALMVELDIPKPPPADHVHAAISAAHVKGADRAALIKALRQARLHGSLESVLSSPTLSTCLRNIVHAHQADPARRYDLTTDGKTLSVKPFPPVEAMHASPDLLSSLDDSAIGEDFPAVTPTKPNPPIDRMRLAAGDDY